MKKTTLALALSLMASGSALAGTFTNGGFENGDFTGWTQGGGCWGGGSYFGWSCGAPLVYGSSPMNPSLFDGGTSNNAIVTAGNDPIVGANLNTVYSGTYSARVNDWVNNYGVSTIKQSVTNYTDAGIFFAWAAVLEASHGATDSDNFTLKLTDDTTGETLVSREYNSYNNGAIFSAYGSWFYTAWQVESLDVSTRSGHDFTLTLLASDCPYGGHAGYVYLDGFGGVIPPSGETPEPATLALLGLGAAGMGAIRRRKSK